MMMRPNQPNASQAMHQAHIHRVHQNAIMGGWWRNKQAAEARLRAPPTPHAPAASESTATLTSPAVATVSPAAPVADVGRGHRFVPTLGGLLVGWAAATAWFWAGPFQIALVVAFGLILAAACRRVQAPLFGGRLATSFLAGAAVAVFLASPAQPGFAGPGEPLDAQGRMILAALGQVPILLAALLGGRKA